MPVFSCRTALASLLLTTAVGCTTVAPRYTPLPENVNRLRDSELSPVKVAEFTTPNRSAVENLTIRGGKYVSPYDDSFVAYLQAALRQDLDDARLLDPSSSVEVGGVLLRNELNAAGLRTADAQIQARFTVSRAGEVCYDRTHSASYEWETSFVGAIAIPRAQQNYPTVIQRLLSTLYADPDFLAALKQP